MAEEAHAIRGINWRETFPFTHIFRSFRIAIHPSKLVLALLALLALYTGGRVLDAIWASDSRAVPGEIGLYEASLDAKAFREARLASRAQTERDAARYLREHKLGDKRFTTQSDALREVQDDPSAASRHISYEAGRELEEELDKLAKNYKDQKDKLEEERKTAADDQAKRIVDDRLTQLARSHEENVRSAHGRARAAVEGAKAIRGYGLFDTFFNHQARQINQIVRHILAGNWLGDGGSETVLGGEAEPGRMRLASRAAGDGVFVSVYKFFTVAPGWALQHHWLYFLLFGAMFLVVWSLFGGAIARIAAVHVADEGRKLSVRQGLNFSTSKFLSFISAPLIPLIIVAGLGLVIAVGGLMLYIPWLGEILVGALFFLALAAGFVMTLVLLGTIGGMNLMYPTIAVEGSDSFDAISRSFSYVYARPWRMLFYSIMALVYGALCYLFVRLFVYIMLGLTRFFVGLLVWRAGDQGDYWMSLFPGPTSLWWLPYDVDFAFLPWSGKLAAFMICFWVYMVIAMLGAFAISFYFSSNTIIYYLMRREVDAAEMDDVYLEAPEEDFAETAPTTPASTTTAPAASTSEAPTTMPPPGHDSGAAQTYPAPTPPPGEAPPPAP